MEPSFQAVMIDWLSQYPTYDGVHIFTDYLSNLGQILILIHLILSSWVDTNRLRFKNRNILTTNNTLGLRNKIIQLAIGQSVLNSLNFVILSLGKWNLQNIHEHFMNICVMSFSYTISDVRFRKRDVLLCKLFQFELANLNREIGFPKSKLNVGL